MSLEKGLLHYEFAGPKKKGREQWIPSHLPQDLLKSNLFLSKKEEGIEENKN